MRILNAAQMRTADRRTIDEIGIPSIVLMENAGREVVAALEAAFDDLSDRSVAVVCGRGNNGGDGFVVARTLQQRNVDARVFLVGSVADVRGDARVNLEILGRLGTSVVEIANEHDWELHFSELSSCDLVVDALFGTGLREPLTGLFETIVADLNTASAPIVSIDLPSGLSSDTHQLIGPAIDAAMTVTLGAPKLSLVMPPSEARAGDLVIADIGIPADVIDALEGPRIHLLTRERMRDLVQPRHPESHKGDFGRVLIVAGSVGKSGAAHLVARAALRSGAGLVTVATPRSCQPVLASLGVEYMTEPLPDTPDGRVDESGLERVLAMRAEVVAIGPGLGVGPETERFVHGLLERGSATLIVDADGLNAFARDSDRLQGRDGLDLIITPHPGEMARLIGTSVEDVQANRLDVARTFATTHRAYVVLKGHRTVIATPDGQVYLNLTGNPGMASGGSGDVLTGVIAGWFAQLLDPEAACRLGVYLHGAAGDLAEADQGETALIAGDIVERLGNAVSELTGRPKTP